jgi:hypothetical protein
MATYFVDGAVGSDANAGTSAGAGNAWATVQKAANTATAGDKVWVKASANYPELVSFNTGAHTGTGASRLVFEGYTTTTGDGGRATITGSGSRASCVVFDGTMDYISLVNFDLTSPTTQCISATGQVDGLVIDNVRMLKGSGTPSKGMTGNGYGRFAATILTRCVVSGGFSSNGLEGFAGGLIEDTIITGCGGNGYSGQGYMNAPEFRRCLVTLNTGDGLHFPGAQTNISVNNCTIDGNGGDGVDVGGANNQVVVIRNNLITNHTAVGAKGLVVGAESGTTTVFADYNFYWNNTTNTSGTNASGTHDVTTALTVDPYTNAAGSNWNLNATAGGGAVVRAAASAINDGTNVGYRDGGALQHADPAGGTTYVISPTINQFFTAP